ncbi:MAG: uroporphyrinogen-III C-methyltransferase [Alcanivoracaceae bacterium]
MKQFLNFLLKSRPQPGNGQVWLVGAGPGDPGLLTMKAHEIIRQADIVVHDRLVSDDIMRLVPARCQRVYVGKAAGQHAMRQDEINRLLVLLGQQGKRVARLKGGDPFTFGRGGEEMQALRNAGIPVTIIPGITAAAGCAAQAGIPLTDRHFADSVCYVTATRREDAPATNWRALANDPARTLVFYMGLAAAGTISEQLIHHGLPKDTPAVLIENGTTRMQREVHCSLATLRETAVTQKLRSPCLIIVGAVTTLAHKKVELAAAHSADGLMLDGRDLPQVNLSQVRGKNHETRHLDSPGDCQRPTVMDTVRQRR